MNEYTWSARAVDRLGHHATELLIIAIGATIVVGLRPLPPTLAFGAAVALVGLVLFSWVLLRQHDRRLCEACLSSMPLNPSEQATRYGRRFWTAHAGLEPRFLLPYLVVLIGSNFAPGTGGRIAWALVQSSMIYLVLAHSTHRRLQPWCPWCRDGGGGQDVVDPEPVVPSDDRQPV